MPLTSLVVIAGIGLIGLKQWLKQKERDHKHRAWLRLPTFARYDGWAKTQQNRNGVHCYHCGSRSIRQFGLEYRNDQRRIHACNHCNVQLYRTIR